MNRAFLFIIALFSLLPLLYFPNPGHDALLIPFNIFIWEIVAASVFFAGLYIYKHKTLVFPRYAIWILALPAGMILSGFLTGLERPVDWMFRLGAILMGLLFFFSLFQFQPNRRMLDNAIYIILFGMLANALISFLQMMPGRPLSGLIPHPETPRAVGVFMQPNILASAMVTAILLALYQISSPAFGKRSGLIKLLCFATLFAASMIVLSTGSRIGLLGLVFSLPLLLFARYKVFARRRHLALAAMVVFAAGCGTGLMVSEGALKAYSKLERLAEEGTEARPHVYRISWELFTEKPISGHGIGSFQSVFHERAAEYQAERGGEPLIGHARFTHTHNELLFWAVEGGILALSGIVVLLAVTLIQAWRLGRQRGLALLALMTPIALHTQTELPFYSSIYHWVLFLFLAFMLFRPLCRFYQVERSETVLVPIPAAGMAVLVATLMFCTSTFGTARDLTRFLLYKEVNMQELRAAQDNLYFNEFATLLSMKVLLNLDLKQNTQHWTQTYINWTEDYLQKIPETSSFHDLALAYNHLGMKQKAHEVIDRGLYLFPQHPVIGSAREKINNRAPAQAATIPDETLVTDQ
ncbi:O-antigen ligase C-terminal domain-containing protein [Marinobacterium sp. AK62]|uniref:O-antigen ligase C-terminal domain-containing protein n=1 Tax=Marinobacterium alkalitolerans TaxID=1542925 RepID=A0ABS3ZAY3_9GAMM|nr:Wzy polymerase domain-containing protein [Marinobacterium alkalitolerans]MBP0048858.1 O-antigen ligase C-terminal domain-containing protein [Marinobacterium alkalitolerans]